MVYIDALKEKYNDIYIHKEKYLSLHISYKAV
jgi:hypothetical protein